MCVCVCVCVCVCEGSCSSIIGITLVEVSSKYDYCFYCFIVWMVAMVMVMVLIGLYDIVIHLRKNNKVLQDQACCVCEY